MNSSILTEDSLSRTLPHYIEASGGRKAPIPNACFESQHDSVTIVTPLAKRRSRPAICPKY
jgi:hypothetical protein